MPKYLYNIGLGLSVTLNAILGGQPYQTFSARNFDWYIKNKYNIVSAIDTVLGKDHCWKCYKNWKWGIEGDKINDKMRKRR
mgnify:FL=1|jgi:hypothetical protein